MRTLFTAALLLVLGLLSFALIPSASASLKVNQSSSSIVTVPNCVQPPSNVDHASFTDSQLDLYGLPHRSAGEPLAQWQTVVRSAKIRICQGTKGTMHHNLQSAQLAPQTYDEDLPTWAGNIAIGYGYTQAAGQWNVPCLTLLLHDGGASPWVGLGGDGNDGGLNLVQAGTDSYEVYRFPRWIAVYQAWIEDWPNDPNEVVAFGVNCGDTMVSVIWQDYSNGNPVKAHMYISDVSSGQYWSAYNTQSFSDGSTAEWIIERGSPYSGDLADFNYVNITTCYAIQYGYYGNPITLEHNYSTMYWNGHSLVYVGPPYQDNSDIGAHFTMDWLHSH